MEIPPALLLQSRNDAQNAKEVLKGTNRGTQNKGLAQKVCLEYFG